MKNQAQQKPSKLCYSRMKKAFRYERFKIGNFFKMMFPRHLNGCADEIERLRIMVLSKGRNIFYLRRFYCYISFSQAVSENCFAAKNPNNHHKTFYGHKTFSGVEIFVA